MKKISLLFSFIILSCTNHTEPNIETWGDDSTGYTVRVVKAGKSYYKWSDLSKDTVAMQKEAETWFYKK